MPMINLEYDDARVSEKDIRALSLVIKEIVSKVTGIADVFVYTNTAKIKIQVAPVEIFVRMSAEKITDESNLVNKIKAEIIKWKTSSKFSHPINLTLIPMKWKVEIGI